MKKDDIASQVIVIVIILAFAFIGGYALNPLFAILGMLMALTSGIVAGIQYKTYRMDQEIQEGLTQNDITNTKHVAA